MSLKMTYFLQSSALVSHHIFFSTSNQAAFLGHLLPLIRQNQAANAHIDGATPSYLARTWPKNSGAPLGADLGRKRPVFWAKHGLNIEGYVGPLGALLAAFGPKINPNGSMVPLRLNFGSVLGLCWAIWRLQKTRVKFYCFTRVFLGALWSLLGPI